jgi:phenylalanine-4-hydroxylase
MRTALVELASDHPGFNDPAYRSRRDEIARVALAHRPGEEPERIAYTEAECETWTTIFDALVSLYPTHACKEFLEAFELLHYRREAIPQLADVSALLARRTGFRLEPVAGLVSPREFLSALGRRVFLATQYIRHGSRPHYTPEPDVVHELMGHAPMLAVPGFADLSQRIGKSAEGASEQKLQQLATLYWYTVEYGVVREGGALLAYGAGLLSSFGELALALRGGVEVRPLEPDVAKDVAYPITRYQPLLWEVDSISEALRRVDGLVSRW